MNTNTNNAIRSFWIFAQRYDVRMFTGVFGVAEGVASLFFQHWILTISAIWTLPFLWTFTTQFLFAQIRGKRWFFDDAPERLMYLQMWLLWFGVWVV